MLATFKNLFTASKAWILRDLLNLLCNLRKNDTVVWVVSDCDDVLLFDSQICIHFILKRFQRNCNARFQTGKKLSVQDCTGNVVSLSLVFMLFVCEWKLIVKCFLDYKISSELKVIVKSHASSSVKLFSSFMKMKNRDDYNEAHVKPCVVGVSYKLYTRNAW